METTNQHQHTTANPTGAIAHSDGSRMFMERDRRILMAADGRNVDMTMAQANGITVYISGLPGSGWRFCHRCDQFDRVESRLYASAFEAWWGGAKYLESLDADNTIASRKAALEAIGYSLTINMATGRQKLRHLERIVGEREYDTELDAIAAAEEMARGEGARADSPSDDARLRVLQARGLDIACITPTWWRLIYKGVYLPGSHETQERAIAAAENYLDHCPAAEVDCRPFGGETFAPSSDDELIEDLKLSIAEATGVVTPYRSQWLVAHPGIGWMAIFNTELEAWRALEVTVRNRPL